MLPAVLACGESAQALMLLWCLLLGFSVVNSRGYSLGRKICSQSRDAPFMWLLETSDPQNSEWNRRRSCLSCFPPWDPTRENTALASDYLPSFLIWALLGCMPKSRPCQTWHRRPMHPYWILFTTWQTKPAELLHLWLGRNSVHPLALSVKSMASGVCMSGF